MYIAIIMQNSLAKMIDRKRTQFNVVMSKAWLIFIVFRFFGFEMIVTMEIDFAHFYLFQKKGILNPLLLK